MASSTGLKLLALGVTSDLGRRFMHVNLYGADAVSHARRLLEKEATSAGSDVATWFSLTNASSRRMNSGNADCVVNSWLDQVNLNTVE